MLWRKGLPARWQVVQFAFQEAVTHFVIYNWHSCANTLSASFSLYSWAFVLLLFFVLFFGRKVWPWEPISRPKFAYSLCNNEAWCAQHWRQMAAVLSPSGSFAFLPLACYLLFSGCLGQPFAARSIQVSMYSCCLWWCWLAPYLAFEGTDTDLVILEDLAW